MTTKERKGASLVHGHSGCFVCSPREKGGLGIEFSVDADGVLHGGWVAGERFQSHDGVLHGGIIATLLDSAMTHCLLARGVSAFTGRLSIRFFKPVEVGKEIDMEAKVERRVGKLFLMSAALREGENVLARAEGRLMSVNSASKPE